MYIPRLKILRQKHGLTQKEVAALLHISCKSYGNYERGVHTLPSHCLIPLSIYYQVSADYLLGRTDDPRPYPAPRRKQQS